MKPYYLFAAFTLPIAWPAPAAAAPPAGAVVEDAIDVLDDLAGSPDKRVPPNLLRDAAAVVIAPDVVKAGFVVAGRRGHGVLLVRTKAGWSDPVFVTLTGGSVGWQAGLAATDVFLVIRDARSLDRIFRGGGKLTLGADASVAAGPVGRDVKGATDAQLRSEILSYSRSKGLFAGVALEGDSIQVDHLANDRYYGKRRVTVPDIVTGKVDAPRAAGTLRGRLDDWSADEPARRPPPPPARK